MLYACRIHDSISIYISDASPGSWAHNVDQINSLVGTNESEKMAIVEFMFEWSDLWIPEEIPVAWQGKVVRLYSAPLA